MEATENETSLQRMSSSPGLTSIKRDSSLEEPVNNARIPSTSRSSKGGSSSQPRPFPLSPPAPLPTVAERDPVPIYVLSDDEDDLPVIHEMLARTRPDFSQSQTPVSSKDPVVRKTKSLPLVAQNTRVSVETNESEVPKTPMSEPSHSKLSLTHTDPQLTRKRKEPDSDLSTQSPTRSSKRPKAQQTGRFRKHCTHWLLDGKIVLQIQKVRFKLHRSTLTKHSTLFEKLFESEADVETVEGYPLYKLDKYGVEAEDFEVLLDALDKAITFYYSPPPFPVIASILRSSTALSFNLFSAWATRFLEEMFPPTLEHVSLETRIPWAAEAVVLARKCDVKTVLKRALFELVRMEGFGQDLDDGDAGVLSQTDYKALLKAREQLTSFWLLTAALPSKHFNCPLAAAPAVDSGSTPAPDQPAANPGVVCPTSKPSLSVEKHTKLVHTSGIFEDYLFDPVCGIQALMDAPWEEEGYCAGCVTTRKEAWRKARVKVWENLNIWFALGEDSCVNLSSGVGRVALRDWRRREP